ncbi:MAG TPA: PQQ-binding-like beta-propeller repeat protein [Bacillota bacterium]|jgi:outer membrane protein assembly factor BamB|nr:PQQ-binding-like beta-propeller repeat protein [Fastidiosipila sp.]HPX92843.1 PQQ-binding-like beta-propeller repeat protein [Bacillota bacterium]HQB81328.1 PQQ-binding-like beta-propeller repeat protein [Bacillota bacterium]
MKKQASMRLAAMILVMAAALSLLRAGRLSAQEAAPLPTQDYWYAFRGDEDHNAVKEIDHVKGPATVKYWGRMDGKLSEWGTNSKSGILVIGEFLYFASDDQLYRLSKEGELTGQLELKGPVGYAARPAFTGGIIILPLDGGALEAVDPHAMESVWYQQGPGDWEKGAELLPLQNTSSLTIYNGICYSLTLALDENWMAVGGYVHAVDIRSGETIWLHEDQPEEGGSAGFHMTGSVILDHWLVTGSEKGDLMVFDAQKGQLVSTLNLGSKINSDLVRRDYRLYFTTYDGRLIACEFDPHAQELEKRSDTAFALKSISTPAIYGGRLYVGGLAEYGDWETATPDRGVLAVIDMKTMEVAEQHEVDGEVGASPLVIAGRKGTPYVYFTANQSPGSLYVLVEGQVEEAYQPSEEEGNYTLFSPVADQNGTVYYALDSGYVFAIAEMLPPPSASDPGIPAWYFVAGAGGLVLVAFLLFLVIKARKGKMSV